MKEEEKSGNAAAAEKLAGATTKTAEGIVNEATRAPTGIAIETRKTEIGTDDVTGIEAIETGKGVEPEDDFPP